MGGSGAGKHFSLDRAVEAVKERVVRRFLRLPPGSRVGSGALSRTQFSRKSPEARAVVGGEF